MPVDNYINKLTLKNFEREALKNLVLDITNQDITNFSINHLMRILKLYSVKLPIILHEYMYDLKYEEKYHILLLDNLPFSNYPKEKTPLTFADIKVFPFSNDEIMLLLIGSLVGDVFTWNTIQEGRIINHVFPIKENEFKPISSNSKISFGLHTEDAFHDYAGDYLMLLSYRNKKLIPTTVVFLESLNLNDDLKYELFKKDFFIGHNIAHEFTGDTDKRVPILFGNFKKPYVKINLNPNRTIGLTLNAKKALIELEEIIINNKRELLIEENQIAIIDNFRTIHGREEYVAEFNGLDRWLKRIYITRDIRKSRDARDECFSNIINPSK